MYRRDRSLRDNSHSHSRSQSLPQRRRTPSFSSSLLDAVYRSIDHESNDVDREDLSFYCDENIIRKHRNFGVKPVEEVHNLRRAIMIENWMEKQSSLGSKCSTNFNHSTSTTSSDSSSAAGAVFSSSEAEYSNYKQRSRRSKPMKCMQFEKRIINEESNYHQQKQKQKQKQQPKQNPSRDGGFTKTKLKALNLYGELKKVKQPISPGGRFTSFLNSIFSSGNGKKVNVCTVKAMEDVNSDTKSKSGCSSSATTSFSRSCLSKTPPSSGCRGKYNSSNSNGMKRSKETAVGTLLARSRSSYPKKGITEFVSRSTFTADDEEEDEDDALSCSSSDLFELDHLKGIGRYREELPVYETTNLKKNQAIANLFIL
ncbi:protein BIG GRAIN 1-like B [Melia azedarach]|uniref:Protein BIG GRAIN 1-like B n=1 Tax=Melia azedarach TaxID=155640 RepID=A0ACC1XDS0_MELAZ|nr:protein BIG GRAIN 1-like B [Melia azedarach]